MSNSQSRCRESHPRLSTRVKLNNFLRIPCPHRPFAGFGLLPEPFCLNRSDRFVSFVPTVTHHQNGGGERNRTDDLLLAKQALSQLSYTPVGAMVPPETSGDKRITTDPGKWWAWVDLNYRPHAYQACALTRLSYRPILCLAHGEQTPTPAFGIRNGRDTKTAACGHLIVK